MSNFRQNTDSMYDIPKRFADEIFEHCPFCGVQSPDWLVKEVWRLLDRDYYFKCPVCESVMKAAQSDVTGLSFTTASIAGLLKKQKAKDNRTVYIKVEQVGNAVENREVRELSGKELPLPTLLQRSAKGVQGT